MRFTFTTVQNPFLTLSKPITIDCDKCTRRLTDPNEIENNRDADTVDRDGIIRNYGDHHRRPPPAIGRDNDNDNNIYEHGLHELDLNEYELYNPQDHYAKATPQHPCDANHFKCQNNVCIPIHLRCDGYHHCNDRSDEADCDRYRPPTTTRRPVTFAPTSYFWTTAAPGSLERQTTNAPPFDRVTAPATRPTNPIPITTSGVASSRFPNCTSEY